jgi:hypothetical protein
MLRPCCVVVWPALELLADRVAQTSGKPSACRFTGLSEWPLHDSKGP